MPIGLINWIEKMEEDFIWNKKQKENNPRPYLINWLTITLPKDKGGLAIRDMRALNKADLMKIA
ncbi:ribonuclease H [Senna tora]|uniref:Ribonuclease H n=1 Tax=Senna tora TaxID=362788 RepID=A0A834U1E9_9FABA|nr:ribonuclease H [Senna tora]